jgi:hypothetical protein
MEESPKTYVVQLDEDELDTLERRLAIAISHLTPGAISTVRGVEDEVTQNIPQQVELEEMADDILNRAKTGVRIAPLVESHPLIPLFRAAKIDLPPEIKVDHEELKYDFYYVEVIFSILMSKEEFPLSAGLRLVLTDDAQDAARRVRPIRLFPGRKDIQFFTADVEGAIGIDASMNIATPPIGLSFPSFSQVSAKLAAEAHLKANFVVGPLTFPFRKAALEVRGESDQDIYWRYNLQSELRGTNSFKSVLVLKVAQEIGSVQMTGILHVVPCKRRWLIFKEFLPELSDKIPLTVELVTKKGQ